MASEKEKMIAERLYHSFGPELTSERTAARRLCEEFNRTTGTLLHVGSFGLPVQASRMSLTLQQHLINPIAVQEMSPTSA